MRILVVGGGGREHAIIWSLAKSKRVTKLFAAPGNAGIGKLAECANIKATDIKGVINFSKENDVDLVFVAPDDPLYLGMVDQLEAAGIRAFGPEKAAAEIEGSKVFAKELMKKYGIPTAGYEVFDHADAAKKYLAGGKFPAVIKADGLALGKGVVIAADYEEAEKAIDSIMIDKIFGSSGDRVLIEECLTGPEVSVLAFCDGKTVVPMVSAQDHKRVYDGDKGPNTGGMGTFSPSRIYTDELAARCMEEIFEKTVSGMRAEGRPFKGVLYFGLMLTESGPKVIEYNSRFGDPETQVVLPRLKTDLLDIIEAVIEERLDEIKIEWDDGAAVCVIMASGGYPGKYSSGYKIEGIKKAEDSGLIVFHSGTKRENGELLSAGGRVLGITALGGSLDDAIKKAYKGVSKITFEGAQYRGDIGVKA